MYNYHFDFNLMWTPFEVYTKGGIRIALDLFDLLVEEYGYDVNDFIYVES